MADPSVVDQVTELLAGIEAVGGRKARHRDWRDTYTSEDGRAEVLAAVRPIAEQVVNLLQGQPGNPQAALDAVLDLHQPKQCRSATVCAHCWDRIGDAPQEWPCDTYRAVSGAMERASDRGEDPARK